MSRIVAICDSYDEMVNTGPARGRTTPFRALMCMKEQSSKLDPAILVEFILLLGGELTSNDM